MAEYTLSAGPLGGQTSEFDDTVPFKDGKGSVRNLPCEGTERKAQYVLQAYVDEFTGNADTQAIFNGMVD